MGELYCDSMWHWDYDLEEDEAREGRPKDNSGWLLLFGGLSLLFLAIPAIAVAPAVAAGAGAAQAAAGAAAAAAAAAIAFLGLHRLMQKSGWFSHKRSDVQDVRVRHCT